VTNGGEFSKRKVSAGGGGKVQLQKFERPRGKKGWGGWV